jgi:hypothetical protein
MERQYSGLTVIGCTVLAINSGLAIYNSRGADDPASVAFVLLTDAALLLLFLCLVRLERARAGTSRGRLKAAVWALTTLLTVMLASRVAPLMPPAMATVVWLMATATTAGGFWAFFLN